MFNNNYSMNELDFGLNVSSMDVQNPDDSSGINISDVIEVIETDTAFAPMQPRRPRSDSETGGAYIKIIEQPASKALRFRYECEGRSAGSLPGVNSTPENKTFPTIQIVGYKGRAVVVVSCVTKDPPYRPHPHNLVGKENCKKGVCTVEVNGDTMTATFANLGIQCIKKKDIEEALTVRQSIQVDPFQTGFGHKTQASSIDLNSVRLCFQAFLEGPQRGKFTRRLTPVVSDPIYDKKAMADLVICKLSHCSASVAGGQEVILLCEKVAKEDISVRFFEEKDGQVVWEGMGEFTPAQVHKQAAISFRTPRYRSLEIDHPVQAFIQLRRPSDSETSEPLPFQITPIDSGRPFFWSLRRNKANYISFSEILQHTIKEPTITVNDNNNNSSSPVVSNNFEESVTIQKEESMKVETRNDPMKNVIVIDDPSTNEVENDVNGNFEELLESVNSLDNVCPDNNNELEFNVYGSLQMAMKNPHPLLDMPYNEGYEDIAPPRPIKVSESDEAPPLPPKRFKKSPSLPPPPPPHKGKLNLFQKLFSTGKRKKKSDRESREGSVASRVSQRSASFSSADVRPRPQETPVIDLTEAEHYALYDSFAPRATASEFDEMSFYYSTVERQKVA